jgi:predicted GNAT family acetyltransferase
MIIHEPEQQRFVIRRDEHLARLDYRLGPDWIDFTHTFTPPALRGQGLAAQLVAAGVAHARAQGLQIRASCSYVASWLAREQSSSSGPSR